MTKNNEIKMKVEGFYSITPLRLFRKTPGVVFDIIPEDLLKKTSSIDRVLHDKGAVSPGPIEGIERPWYMHHHQQDNLVVLHGHREVDLYSLELKKMITFKVYADKIIYNNKIILNEGGVLTWDNNVFHRIVSGLEGSASLNFAVRSDKFDVKNNFNIYKLDQEVGEYSSIRDGFKDQF